MYFLFDGVDKQNNIIQAVVLCVQTVDKCIYYFFFTKDGELSALICGMTCQLEMTLKNIASTAPGEETVATSVAIL